MDFFPYKEQIVHKWKWLVITSDPSKKRHDASVCWMQTRNALALLGTILIGHVSDYYQC